MTTVVEVLVYLLAARDFAADRAAEQDPFSRGLAMGMEDGLDMAIRALEDLPLMAGRRSSRRSRVPTCGRT